MQSVSGTLNLSYGYDANGNQTSGGNRTVTWTSYNMPASITANGKTDSFAYDDRHQRITRTDPTGTTIYINEAGIIAELQKAPTSSAWRDQLFHGGMLVGEYYNPTGNCLIGQTYVPLFIGGQIMGTYKAPKYAACASQTALRYFQSDGLGSVAVITDASGNLLERDSYDTWGKRRYPTGADDSANALSNGQADRGLYGTGVPRGCRARAP